VGHRERVRVRRAGPGPHRLGAQSESPSGPGRDGGWPRAGPVLEAGTVLVLGPRAGSNASGPGPEPVRSGPGSEPHYSTSPGPPVGPGSESVAAAGAQASRSRSRSENEETRRVSDQVH
jgi:hypothetical protein